MLDRLRVIHMALPSYDHLDALLPAVVANLARERGLDASCIPPLDGDEHSGVASTWPRGSVRICAGSSKSFSVITMPMQPVTD